MREASMFSKPTSHPSNMSHPSKRALAAFCASLCAMWLGGCSGELSSSLNDGGSSSAQQEAESIESNRIDAGGSDAGVSVNDASVAENAAADASTTVAPDATVGTPAEPATPQPSPPRGCGSVAHGASESRTRYASATVPHGSTCVSETQTRTCQDGTFSAWTGSFTHTSCETLQRNWCRGIPASEGAPLSFCKIEIERCTNGSVSASQNHKNYGANVTEVSEHCARATQDCLALCGPGSRAVGLSHCPGGLCAYERSN